ncbi:U3 small nucleolar RNA-associated protein 18 homolog [Nilaparvata lugens]|uniref:U3 small nucleolar RNA-associated protein 18 homolog n=1 Tax=Nilaparvata lugens TaxID=108931 RepID=UPI00193D32D7|nr:U3 small nucleolar RNA-associated protein 18 homolog [Nilaparvata lugens]
MDVSSKVSKAKKTKDKQLIKRRKLAEEIERLEDIVFGDTSKVIGEKKSTKKNKRKLSCALYDEESSDEDNDKNSCVEDNKKVDKPKKTPAWEDDDDDESIQAALKAQNRGKIEHPGAPTDAYTSMLKRKFESINGVPKWAELNRKTIANSDDSEEDEDDSLLQRCGNLIQKSKTLDKEKILFKLVKSLNVTTETEGPVLKAVEFHPTSSIGLVAGFSGIASLFEVDGKVNAKLQSVQFTKFCIDCAKFTADGNRFIVGSKFHRHFFYHDLLADKTTKVVVHKQTDLTNMKKFEVSPDGKLLAVCGRFGNIYLLSATTYEWIDTLTMNANVEAVCFSSDGSNLYSVGGDGNVYVWKTASRRCSHRFVDDGCLTGTSVAVSPDGRLLAAGSSAGVVNVYSAEEALASGQPTPLKTFMNLTTRVSALQFNHTSQLLAMASDKSDRSLKLAHFPSMTVYSNFPLNSYNHIPTGMPQSLSFSPHSRYLGVASNIKKAFLYRLNHFESY